jgi:hypothetical protein
VGGVGGGVLGNGFDFGFELGGLLVAAVGFGGEGAEDDGVEADVEEDFLRGKGKVAAGEFAGEELVEDDAEGVDVGAVVDGGGAVVLFGGHVGGGAEGGVLSPEF